MLRNFKYLIFAFLILSSCHVKQENVNKNTATAQLPKDFKSFYEAFHSDSAFQVNHVLFPLKAQISYKDSSSVLTIDSVYTQDNWALHQAFIQENGFVREFNVIGDLVTEITKDNLGLMSIERRWGVLDSSWYLIYYHTIRNQW